MKFTVDCTPSEALQMQTWIAAFAGGLAEGEASQVERNKAILTGFQEEVFNSNDWTIETLSKYLTPDIIDHSTRPGDRPGIEGVKERFEWWQRAFTAAKEEQMAILGGGDLVAVRYNLTAEHIGDFMGIPPTHRQISIPGIEFLRFRDGRISEHWGIYDIMGTAAQIGASLTLTPMTEKRDSSLTLVPDEPKQTAAE